MPHSANTRRRRKALLDLRPGVQGRIISELDRVGVPRHAHARHLAELTGCAVQTAIRWVDREAPGLPDAPSIVALCVAFGVDANWLLGLTRRRAPLPACDPPQEIAAALSADTALAGWTGLLVERLKLAGVRSLHVEFVAGDEMEPAIAAGSPVIVDTAIQRIDLNGVYALRHGGQLLVRRAEVRIGQGVVLHCANPAYAPLLVSELDVKSGSALDVVGRVRLAFQAHEW